MRDAEHPADTARVLVVGSAPWLDTFEETFESTTDGTVTPVDSAAAALDAVRSESFGCIVTDHRLPDATGIELVEPLRESSPAVQVVLGTSDGSESIASEAIRAGVSDYVAISEPVEQSVVEMVHRVQEALRSGRRQAIRRERAWQFDAVFQDEQTATWVLDTDGSLVRVNRSAREMVEADVDSLIGEPFWLLPWWSRTEGTAEDVRTVVNKAREGTFGDVVIYPSPGETDRVIDLSVRPVQNDVGELVSIIVEGIDVTDQVELDRELRKSEELHRVTLNNMTDTVLITNEDGEYTYVCPNVHFIFGYTADEIHDQGTIDALLGEDLFDRSRLAEVGVLKNIECRVTDKAGREHTLLVNVREVSIQDGTILYSCRDVTKRKQREDALANLQETVREFLYAETNQEIAQQVVDDVSDLLGLTASAVYLFDVDANELRPVAHTPAMTERHGPLPIVHADGNTLPSYSFITDETLIFEDVHTADRLQNQATDLRGTLYIPLGDHGVFVAGSTEVGAFDEVTQELADLLAASAEAAFDRVAREAQLREQDRELQRRNEQLTALNRINDTIREIDQAVVRAESREEIDHTVCERLTDTDRFKFAWIGRLDPTTQTVDPQAWAGDEQGYLDQRSTTADSDAREPAGRTAATGEPTMVSNVAADLREDPWRSEALTRDFLSVLGIPLEYNDRNHGVLTVYADTTDAFDETTRAVLGELGETIAAALSALERKHALLTTSMTRIEFGIEDSRFLLSRLARKADCVLSYEGGIQHTDAGDRVFVTVKDADVDAVAEIAAGAAGIDSVTRISGSETGRGVLRLHLSGPFLALDLADHGAIFREATATQTGTTLVVDVPERIDVRNIVQVVQDTVGTVDLRRKESLDRGFDHDVRSNFLTDLTDRQLEVIQTAYYSGYFESPREKSGEDVADTLEISPPAFYQHVRTVQRKLFETLFDDGGASSGALTGGIE